MSGILGMSGMLKISGYTERHQANFNDDGNYRNGGGIPECQEY